MHHPPTSEAIDIDAAHLVAWSALLFGVARSWKGGAFMAWTTVFGLVAAPVTLHSGSVWPAIALHVGWNLIVGGMMHTVYRRRGLTS